MVDASKKLSEEFFVAIYNWEHQMSNIHLVNSATQTLPDHPGTGSNGLSCQRVLARTGMRIAPPKSELFPEMLVPLTPIEGL